MRQASCGAWEPIQPIGMLLDRWERIDLAATVEEYATEDGRYAFFTPLGRKTYDVKRTATLVIAQESQA